MLFVIATPIGHPKDITVRALETLKKSDLVVGEEDRELSKFLKMNGLLDKPTKLLNEHSTRQDLEEVLNLCRQKNVALISDCGTPGFCDPGADLVQLCYKNSIPVTGLPGPSSLMTALSVSGMRLNQFLFVGFLPQKTEERQKLLKQVAKEPHAQVIMDTPYRLSKLLSELNELMPKRHAFLALDLTQQTERLLPGPIAELNAKVRDLKAEFVLILSPSS